MVRRASLAVDLGGVLLPFSVAAVATRDRSVLPPVAADAVLFPLFLLQRPTQSTHWCAAAIVLPAVATESALFHLCSPPPHQPTLWHGPMDATGDRHGRGILMWGAGNCAEGECVHGKEQGKWVLRNLRGAVFEGISPTAKSMAHGWKCIQTATDLEERSQMGSRLGPGKKSRRTAQCMRRSFKTARWTTTGRCASLAVTTQANPLRNYFLNTPHPRFPNSLTAYIPAG